MPGIVKRNRKEYLLVELFVFVLGAGLFFYNFSSDNKGMSLSGGIVFALMAIFKAAELLVFIKNRNTEKS